MKTIFGIILSMISIDLLEAQIPNPATDPNFYLYTPLSDEFDGSTLSSKWQVDVALWNKDILTK